MSIKIIEETKELKYEKKMSENLEKFVKKLEKIEDYYVLRQEKEFIIIGTKIIIKEHKEILGNVFQPFNKNVDKELPVFFLIAFEDFKCDPWDPRCQFYKEFVRRKLPILNLNKTQISFNVENIKNLLAEFVVSHFKS